MPKVDEHVYDHRPLVIRNDRSKRMNKQGLPNILPLIMVLQYLFNFPADMVQVIS